MKLRGCGPFAVASQGLLQTHLPQNLRTLQRKLEEREEALLGQTQAVELLQQELREAEQQNQVPFCVLVAFSHVSEWLEELCTDKAWKFPDGLIAGTRIAARNQPAGSLTYSFLSKKSTDLIAAEKDIK